MQARAVPWTPLALVLALAGACAHPAGSTVPGTAPVAWIDDPLLGASADEVERLAELARGDLQARLVRLDRLLDLFDAARFGQDEDARETLWAALGGHGTGVGERATREASERMLQLALALGDAAESAATPSVGAYAADAIMMLTTDLAAPAVAEDLSIRTSVYRTIVEQGHPRLADNARWRLYDHVRGTLAGAVEVPAEHRMEVAVQALYAQQDSVEALLADTAPQARPPWPGAEALWTMLDTQRVELAREPRWADVVQRRDGDDHALHDTLRTVLPAVRSEAWSLQTLAAGTARADSLAPVVWIQAGRVSIDEGRSHPRHLPLDADILELSRGLGNALAQDGRGSLLLAADPMLPAPQLHTILRAIFRARAERIELAVREPRLAPAEGTVVMALPLYVTHAAGQQAGDRAWAEARVHVHLDGRGPRVAIDGHWLDEHPATGAGLDALVRRVARAYPRERGVRISLGDDVQLQQLIGLLVALQGGPDRAFAAVGWFADGSMPAEAGLGGDAQLARRTALVWPQPAVTIDQPYPLEPTDQKRLEGFAEDLGVCLPELEAERAPARVTLQLRFEEGRLRATEVEGARRLPKAGVAALVECVEEEGYALRLRGHREGLSFTVGLAPASHRGG